MDNQIYKITSEFKKKRIRRNSNSSKSQNAFYGYVNSSSRIRQFTSCTIICISYHLHYLVEIFRNSETREKESKKSYACIFYFSPMKKNPMFGHPLVSKYNWKY